eukprot:5083295-Amphidinium_carterae.1
MQHSRLKNGSNEAATRLSSQANRRKQALPRYALHTHKVVLKRHCTTIKGDSARCVTEGAAAVST